MRIFGKIHPHRRPAREVVWLQSAERFECEAAGGRIAAYGWGAGPPVLLAHGWEGRGSQMGALATGLAAAGLVLLSVIIEMLIDGISSFMIASG